MGVLALVGRDGALLMEKRSDCGRWGLVGGAVGESLEETGLVVVGQELFAVFPGPSRRSDEPEELRFFRPEELADLDVIETSRPILDAYLDPPRELLPR